MKVKITHFLRRVLGILLAAAALAGMTPRAIAQKAPAAEPDNVRAYTEMLRSDVNGTKIATLNQVLQLTAPEAEKFWPVYRDYEKELASVGDRKLALIREFGASHRAKTLDDAKADDLATRWLKVTRDRVDLWQKYHRKISRSVSPMRAAQFLQVEHQMALFIDLAIASEMPLVGESLPAK